MNDINELLKKSGLKKKYIAEQLGITPTTLSLKLNGKGSFTKPELFMLESILEDAIKQEVDSQKSCATCGYSPQTASCETCEGYSNWWPLDGYPRIDCSWK